MDGKRSLSCCDISPQLSFHSVDSETSNILCQECPRSKSYDSLNKISDSPVEVVPIIPTQTLRAPDVIIDIKQAVSSPLAEYCNFCDVSSSIPHAIQVSRIRVANLCCAGEERIIRSSLTCLTGITSVDVNIIGRYAVVKHCPIQCCAPAVKIVDVLNGHSLGASLTEATCGNEEDEEDERINLVEAAHSAIVGTLFVAGLVEDGVEGSNRTSMILFLTATAIGLIPVLKKAGLAIYRLTLDIHILMLIATIGAILKQEYLDAALLIFLFVLAELIEDVVLLKVRRSIKLSGTHLPKKAYLLSGKSIEIEKLVIGDVIAVRAGEMIVADGLVSKGEGVVDESAITGEAAPVAKKKGDRMLSGSVVQNGYLEVSLTSTTADSTIHKMQQAVLDVQADKGDYGRIVDQLSLYWTPAILVAAILIAVIGGVATHSWSHYITSALVLLVLACPCALVIAAPIPAVCAIATAAKNKVLIRGSTVIEKTGRVSAVATDKTGTLTKGFFIVNDRVLVDTSVDYDPLELAAAIEQKSSHPLANSIVSAFCGCIAEYDKQFPAIRRLKTLEGVGVEGWVEVDDDWKLVAVGNERLLASRGGRVSLSNSEQATYERFCLNHTGCVIVLICVEDELIMLLSLSDETRPEAVLAMSHFRSLGLPVTILTGDNVAAAMKVARELGVPEESCLSRLLPQQKLEWIREKETESLRLLMIGDGINDASALAGSYVGVAMGAGGTAMAAAAADIVMMADNLLLLPATIRLCRLTRLIIIENCVFAIGIKLAAIALALAGKLAFWQAILIDVGTLLLVIANGTRPMVTHFYQNADRPPPQPSDSFRSASFTNAVEFANGIAPRKKSYEGREYDEVKLAGDGLV